MYGDSVISADGTLLRKFKQAAAMITEVGDAGGTIIDILPACQSLNFVLHLIDTTLTTYVRSVRHVPTWLPTWFPGVTVKHHALQLRDLLDEIKNVPVEELRAKRVSRTDRRPLSYDTKLSSSFSGHGVFRSVYHVKNP